MDQFGPTRKKNSKKINLPFEVDLFSRFDRSDQNGPFRLTIPTNSQSQDLAVGIVHVQNGEKYFSLRRSISVTGISIPIQLRLICSCFAGKAYVL